MTLDRYFGGDGPDRWEPAPDGQPAAPIGQIVRGSLKEGLTVKLAEDVSVEDVKVGQYVTIEGERQRFFAMIGDIELRSTDGQLESAPPDLTDPFLAAVLRGTSIYGALSVSPLLTIERGTAGQIDGPRPVKTIPAHYTPVFRASEEDVAAVFGQEDETHFSVGTPLDMETKVCLDLRRLAERSSGVFGKTGTGKTFLTRLILIGLIQKRRAVNLVFDMHSDYGWQGSYEGGASVKGLKQLFPSRVAVFTLDEQSSRRRKVKIEHVVEIPYSSVEPEDIELLKDTLHLTDKAAQASYRLSRHFGQKEWLGQFLALTSTAELNELAADLGEHEGSLAALHRRLEPLRHLPFLKDRPQADAVAQILQYLEGDRDVVIEFGRYQGLTAYILVANILTRRIHQSYVERMEQALGSGQDREKPRPLVITIEEAHKFLSPEVSRQTIFGTIAREMRKFNVTLLVVDQRPSGIDEEVLSQIGTRITCLLDNEKDVDAVLTGISGRSELRGVLAKLESQQQALILGHAVPMPVVIKVRDYGTPESYKDLGFAEAGALHRRLDPDQSDLFNP